MCNEKINYLYETEKIFTDKMFLMNLYQSLRNLKKKIYLELLCISLLK